MKLNSIKICIVAFSFFAFIDVKAQGFNELGIGLGPVSFRGDWGERGDTRTNLGNTGGGINVIHHLSFAYNRNYNRYFNKHFKLRNQLTVHHTNLDHYGQWQRGPSVGAEQLRAMSGQTTVVEIGTGFDWFWTELRSYERKIEVFNPYAGMGVNLVYFNPSVETSLPGQIGAATNTFPTFLPETSGGRSRISNESDITLALNFQAGTRYRLTDEIDLFAEGRWHFYMSDFVDGLDPRGSQNKSNDWMFMLNVGITFYLE